MSDESAATFTTRAAMLSRRTVTRLLNSLLITHHSSLITHHSSLITVLQIQSFRARRKSILPATRDRCAPSFPPVTPSGKVAPRGPASPAPPPAEASE